MNGLTEGWSCGVGNGREGLGVVAREQKQQAGAGAQAVDQAREVAFLSHELYPLFTPLPCSKRRHQNAETTLEN
jgi:hypothetical protein